MHRLLRIKVEQLTLPKQQMSARRRLISLCGQKTKLNHTPMQRFKSLLTKVTILSLVLGTVASIPVANAAPFTAMKDTLTRLQTSVNADHTIVFTLPATFDFDATGSRDALRADFPAGFTVGGTWVAGDFTFNDGTARTVNAVAQGAGIIDVTCTDATNNVGVAIDTTANVFTILPCGSTYTASATGATVTFTIDGTLTDGTLQNPATPTSSSVSYPVVLAQCDNTASCSSSFTSTHNGSFGIGIADDDTVTVTATVDGYLTFDLDTAPDFTNAESSTPYKVAFGSIPTTDSKVSGTTDSVQMIVVEADSNATSGVVVTVRNVNGALGLRSVSTPADDIASADGTIAAGTENYGLCVATAGLTGFSRAAPYDTGTCVLDTTGNAIQGLTTGGENILSSAGPLSAGHAEVVANAAISSSTVPHPDYGDAVTFIATGTF